MLVGESILSWNCRGAASKVFERELQELTRVFKPVITVLLEPKISGEEADKVCKKFGKRRWVRSESLGFSGGVWAIWDDERISLNVLAAGRSYLHMEVQSGDGRRWAITAVYASPHACVR